MRKLKLLLAAATLWFGGGNFANAQSWTASEVSAGTYYLYNVGAQGYLLGANDWGTRASIDATGGIPVTLALNNGAYTISTAPLYNGHFLGSNGYVDGSSYAWTFEPISGQTNTYKLKTGESYLVADGTASSSAKPVTTTVGNDTGDSRAYWKLVTRENLLDLQDIASESSPVWITSIIVNPNFSRNIGKGYGWTSNASNQNLQGGEQTNFCAEHWQSAFTTSQTINNVPNGIYKLRVQAALTDYTNAYDGANYPVVYIKSGAAEGTAKFNNMDTSDRGTDMNTLSASFSAGKYFTEFATVNVTNGQIEIGVRGTRTNTWCIYDNFQLQYCGINLEAYAQTIADNIETATELLNQLMSASAKSALESAISQGQQVERTKASMEAAINELSTAISNAQASIDFLARYTTVRNSIKEAFGDAVDLTSADQSAQSSTTAAEVENAVVAARTAAGNYLATQQVADGQTIDLTNIFIDNPSPGTAGNTNYWTNSSNPGLQYNLYEFYNKAGATTSQTLKGLPAGYYTLTAVGFTRDGYEAKLRAGNNSTLLATVARSIVNDRNAGNDWIAQGNGVTTLTFQHAQASADLEIGLTADANNGDHWMCWRSFKLEYLGTNPTDLFKNRLAEVVSKAMALYDQLPTKAKENLQNVVNTNNKQYNLASDYERAIDAITTATDEAQKIAEVYPSFTAAVTEAEALYDQLPTKPKENLQSVVSTNNKQYNTAAEYETAINAINTALTTAKAVVVAYVPLGIAIEKIDAALAAATSATESREQYDAIRNGYLNGDFANDDIHSKVVAAYNAVIPVIKSQTAETGDFTLAIQNQSFEYGNLTGWTVGTSSDTGVRENSNNTYKTTGCDGDYLFNTWWQGIPLTQEVTDLPNGEYTLTVSVASDGATIYLLANDEHNEGTETGGSYPSSGTFQEATITFLVKYNKAIVGVVGGANGTAGEHKDFVEDGYWWYKADNFRLVKNRDLTLEEEVVSEEDLTKYQTTLQNAQTTYASEEKMADMVRTSLQTTINNNTTIDQSNRREVLAAIRALEDATADANTSIASYKIIASGTVPDNSIEGWVCENSNEFHINTWSLEGNSDGSNMKTPFIENWVANGNLLGTGKVYYQLKGLQPGEVYYAQALVRSYNEASSAAPNGPNFFINDTQIDMTQAGTTFTYNGMSGIYGTLGGLATVTSEGTLTLGVEIASNRNYNWVAFKNVSIRPVIDVYNDYLDEAKSLVEKPMNGDVKASLQSAINKNVNQNSATSMESGIKTLQEAIENAKASIAAYEHLNTELAKTTAMLETTNFYDSYSYQKNYNYYLNGYEQETLTDEQASGYYFSNGVTDRRNGQGQELMLSSWYYNDIAASQTEKETVYVNTWSNEGNTDGSNFTTPFIEYWVSDANVLGAARIMNMQSDLEPSKTYRVKAWVRVQQTTGKEKIANAITMQVGDEGEPVDVSAGQVIGDTQRYIGEYTAWGQTDEFGTLMVYFNVAEGSNVSWLSIRNMEWTEADFLDDDTKQQLATLIKEGDAVKLGFEPGQYAPYNNTKIINALAEAKAIDPDKALYHEVEPLLQVLQTGWTVNEGTTQLNAIYDPQFSLAEANAAMTGWQTDHAAGLGGTYHARVLKDDRLAVFNGTNSAAYLRFDETNSAISTVYTYGATTGYTLPLIEKQYALKGELNGWGKLKDVKVSIVDANGQTVASQTVHTTMNLDDAQEPATVRFILPFEGSDQNYTVQFANATNDHNAIVVSNLSLVTADNEDYDQMLQDVIDNEVAPALAQLYDPDNNVHKITTASAEDLLSAANVRQWWNNNEGLSIDRSTKEDYLAAIDQLRQFITDANTMAAAYAKTIALRDKALSVLDEENNNADANAEVRQYINGTIETAQSAAEPAQLKQYENQLREYIKYYISQAMPAEGKYFDISFLLLNADFATGPTRNQKPEDWELEYNAGEVSNCGWNNYGTHTNGSTKLQFFIEAWRSGNNALGNVNLYQNVYYLPEGNYTLGIDAIAVNQGNSDAETTGAYVYINADGVDFKTSLSTGNGAPEHFETSFANTGDADYVTFGLKSEYTSANWIAADNFTLHFKGALDLSIYQQQLAEAVAEANELTDDDESALPEQIKQQLRSVVAQNNKTYNKAANYIKAITAIQEAVANAKDIAAYAKQLADVVAQAEALTTDEAQLPVAVKENVADAIEENNKTYNKAADYIAAIAAIQEAIDQATPLIEPYTETAKMLAELQAKEYELPEYAQTLYEADLEAAELELENAIDPTDFNLIKLTLAAEEQAAEATEADYKEYSASKAKADAILAQKQVLEDTDANSQAIATLEGIILTAENAINGVTQQFENLVNYHTAIFTDEMKELLPVPLYNFIAAVTVKEGEQLELTTLLTNSNLEGLPTWQKADGWYTEQDGGNSQVMVNDSKTITLDDGTQRTAFFEYWSNPARANNLFTLYQKINLPAGTYNMSCYAFAEDQYTQQTVDGVYFFANDTQGSAITTTQLAPASIEFVQENDGEVKIGLKALTGNTRNWMGIGYVQLYKVNQKEFVIDENELYDVALEGAGNVTLKRTITADIWNTLSLPFSLTNEELKAAFGDDVEVAQFTETVDEQNPQSSYVHFTSMEVPAIQPNTPVLLKTSQSGSEYTFKGRTVVPATNARVMGINYSLVGNYEGLITIPADCYFLSNDKLYRSVGKSTIRGTRAYLVPNDAAAGARIMGLQVDGDQTTGISIVELDGQKAAKATYSLSGQKMNEGSRLRKGVYVIDGRKAVVK